MLSAGKPVLLVFTDPDCGPCTALLPHVAAWQRDLEKLDHRRTHLRGSVDDNRAKAAEHGASRVFIESGDEVSSLYEAQVTPSAVLVDPDGMIASPRVAGEPDIRSLFESTVAAAGRLNVVDGGSRPRPTETRIGEHAPDVDLIELSGEAVSLTASIEAATMLLFWNPDCGFCARALEDLRALERDRPGDAPRLLIVLRGSVESNEAMGLRRRSFSTSPSRRAPLSLRRDAVRGPCRRRREGRLGHRGWRRCVLRARSRTERGRQLERVRPPSSGITVPVR